MKAESTVSIIIPIYNAEDYLQNIIEDVLNQSYSNLQVILINDGSTDDSQKIINHYANIDRRIISVQIKNRGVSNARNIGIELADGEFVRFIDADDRIPRDSIEALVEPILEHADCDIVIGNYKLMPEKASYYLGDLLDEGAYDQNGFLELFVNHPQSHYFGVPWNKLYRKSIIKNHNIKFDQNIHWCEDFLFNIEYYSFCNNFYIISHQGGIYDYYKRFHDSTSLSGRASDKYKERINNYRFHKAIKYCEKYGFDKKLDRNWNLRKYYGKLSVSCNNKYTFGIKNQINELKTLLNDSDVYRCFDNERNNKSNLFWKILSNAICSKQYLFVYLFFKIKYILSYSKLSQLSFYQNTKKSMLPKEPFNRQNG